MAKWVKTEPDYIMTLDVSSKSVGYAMFDVKNRSLDMSGSLKSGREDYSRLSEIADEFTGIIDGYPIYGGKFYEVIVEQPFYVSGKSADLPIKMMHGILLDRMHQVFHPDSEFSWNYISVQTWRSRIVKQGARGMSNKEKKESRERQKLAVLTAMHRYWQVPVKDDDQGDALGILYWRTTYG